MATNTIKQPNLYEENKPSTGLSLYGNDNAPKPKTTMQEVNDGLGQPAPAPVQTQQEQPTQTQASNPYSLNLYSENPADAYIDEIHKAASEKNYKALLQSDIAAYTLKANTQKYLENMLGAQGLNTQGYGSSLHAGAENAAQNLYAQNLANYNADQATAQSEAMDRASGAATESDNQLWTYIMQFSESPDQLDKMMENYGYVKGSNGKWYHKNENGTADLSNPATEYIQTAYDYMATSSQTNNASSGNAQRASNFFAEAEKYEQGSKEYKEAIASGNYNQMRNVGFYIEGLGSGRVNDDIDLTIGKNERDTASEFDLKVDEVIGFDSDLAKELNYAVSGSTDKLSTEANGWWGYNTSFSGTSTGNNHLVLYEDKLYIYTSKGWCLLGSDHSDINKAIQAFKDLGCK